VTVALIGQSSFSTADPAGASVNRPSFYADPLAWVVAVAVERAFSDSAEEVAAAAEDAGVIVISSGLVLPTARAIAEKVSRGRVSPLRFAGANPGVLAALPCMQWQLRGPSLVLVGPPDQAASTALAVAQDWLEHGQASRVACVAHDENAGHHTVRCAVVRSGEDDDRADDVFRLLAGTGSEARAR